MNYGFTITSAGWTMLTKLLAGDRIELTRVMVGKGRVPDDTNPASLTDLVAPVALATSTVPLIQGKTVSFVVEYRSDLNGGLEEGFWLNEFGVYAMDPELGEILLYYATLGDYPQYVSAYTSGSVDIRRYPVSVTLTSELEVVIAYPALAFMTSDDVDEYFRVTALPIFRNEAQKLIDIHNSAQDSHHDIRNSLSQLGARVGRLEDMMLNDVTGNPYIITFGELNGLVVEGVWNQAQQRIEF